MSGAPRYCVSQYIARVDLLLQQSWRVEQYNNAQILKTEDCWKMNGSFIDGSETDYFTFILHINKIK